MLLSADKYFFYSMSPLEVLTLVLLQMCSRLIAGSEILEKTLKNTFDSENVSFFDAAKSAGYARDNDDLSTIRLKNGTYSGFVELHIEQGPIFEAEGEPLF